MMSFWWGSCCSVFVFCLVFYTSLFVLFCWPLFCLSFELRLLITTLVSSKLFFLKVSRHLHMVGFFNGLFEHLQYNHSSKALDNILDWLIDFWCFNATFNNISAISWRPVLVVEEAGVPGENHRPWASNWSTLSLAAASRVHPFCNLQSRARTHAVLVIGLHELLDPTT